MKKRNRWYLFVTALLLFAPIFSFAQKKKKDKNKAQTAQKDEKAAASKKPKNLEETIKNYKKIDGLFTLYRDTITGALYMLVTENQFNKEYIYFSHTSDGVVAAGHFRGNFRDNKIFTIQKYYNRIEFVSQNNNFYFDEKNPISKAAKANISPSVLVSETITAQDSIKKEYLIKADDIFLTENMHQVKPSPRPSPVPSAGFSLGSLNKNKCKYLQIRNYPQNTDIVVEYVYDNPYPTENGGEDVTDARAITIQLQHSIIEVPQNNYKPRFDDPRVGYFTTQVTDMTSTSPTPYRDLIHRWNLEKKDKNATLSEPVEPIVFWIENTTPLEFRDVIRDAVLSWNEAFEQAGFKNAVQVNIQPDDADWDAGDIRYHVLRWTSSPYPPFGGYGPSFVNPRTGQILGADIMLEWVFVTNRLNQEKLFDVAGLPFYHQENETEHSGHRCSLGHHLHHSSLLGQTAMKAVAATELELKEYVKSSLYYLVLHEVGHTLGLMHNMKSSQLHSPAQLLDRSLTEKIGVTGSVMEYPAVNLDHSLKTKVQNFTMKPGPYDKWAIEFGYSPALEDEKAEKARLEKILARSTRPELAFGNDADDMRSPGKAIDPRVMVGDLSNDAITFSTERIKMTKKLLTTIKDKYSKDGQSYHELRNAYFVLTGEMATAGGVIARYIGGVYVDRAMIGQEGATKPYIPVSYKDQKRAMQSLNENLFAPNAFKESDGLYNYLQTQRRGFNFFASAEDPKITDRVRNIHLGILAHILHPNTLQRIIDSELYGNQYKLAEMMNDLTEGIFKADLAGSVNPFRANLQAEYVKMLSGAIQEKSSYAHLAKAQAFYQLKQIERNLKLATTGDAATKAHRVYLLNQIEQATRVKS